MSILPEKILVKDIPNIYCHACKNIYKSVCDWKCEYGEMLRTKRQEYFYWYKPQTTHNSSYETSQSEIAPSKSAKADFS